MLRSAGLGRLPAARCTCSSGARAIDARLDLLFRLGRGHGVEAVHMAQILFQQRPGGFAASTP